MKYTFTGKTKKFGSIILRQIRRVSDRCVGGWIAGTHNLSQEGKCWVGDNAQVCDKACVKDSAQILGNAIVGGVALIAENSVVKGHAIIGGNAQVSGHSYVADYARIDCASIYGHARVFDHARICETALVTGYAEVYGSAIVKGYSTVTDYAKVFGTAVITNTANLRANAEVHSRCGCQTIVFPDRKILTVTETNINFCISKLEPGYIRDTPINYTWSEFKAITKSNCFEKLSIPETLFLVMQPLVLNYMLLIEKNDRLYWS